MASKLLSAVFPVRTQREASDHVLGLLKVHDDLAGLEVDPIAQPLSVLPGRMLGYLYRSLLNRAQGYGVAF